MTSTLITRFVWQGLRMVQELQESASHELAMVSTYAYGPDAAYTPLARLDVTLERTLANVSLSSARNCVYRVFIWWNLPQFEVLHFRFETDQLIPPVRYIKSIHIERPHGGILVLDTDNHPHPSLIQRLDFRGRATGLQALRWAQDHAPFRQDQPRKQRSTFNGQGTCLAESRTFLWDRQAPKAEQVLQTGKVHNLRTAAVFLNGIQFDAHEVFSFWAQVGRPTRRRGFVEGRELRQGCIIPTVGGGLCQLSNGLYDCALQAGLRIVERHAHTQVIPGSQAELGLDATVFWNYIDLRFSHDTPFAITVDLTADELQVRFWTCG